MKSPFLISIITLIVATAIGINAQDASTALPWTSTDGRVIYAKFVKLDGEAVIVEKEGKQITIPLARLSTKSVLDATNLGKQQSQRNAENNTATTAAPVMDKNLTVDLGDGVTMEFVLIQPGAFTMGVDRLNEIGKEGHKVTLTKRFLLAKYEVTQEQWEKVMGYNPSKFKGQKNPVESVSWTDCQSFITKLNTKMPGRGFRLPTEAEWEYACRAGSSGSYCFGNDLRFLVEYAWLGNNKYTTQPVGEKKANEWGLYDVHGNVSEWCEDWYGDYPATAVEDPVGAPSGKLRVNRGGSWYDDANSCTAAARRNSSPSEISSKIGLRLARSSAP
ncbi:MAG: formylglycine-generating enzyme family protein [Verrucomicrobia bacterium]|nr:formylglycine-generating enzyme family protein [Verrucomicrobiota bacterium]